MAEALLFNMAEKLIGGLGSLAIKNWNWNMKDDLENLKNTMVTIKAVLMDAEKQQSTNHEVKHWLERLNDALHDAEDLLDEFSTEALRQQVVTTDHKKAKKVCIFFSTSNKVLFSLKMAQKVKEIREKLEAIDDDRRKFHFTNLVFDQRVEKQRETHSFIREEDVIGREEEKKVLVDFLLSTNMNMRDNVSIISIVGIGGLGKTTLAQLVYNDKAVQGHFELKSWVCVSDDFDVKAIAMKIMGSKTNDEMEAVQQELRKKIEGKRYLVVLDDVWNEDRDLWLRLMTLLMDGGKGSKIVITTRSEKVAMITGTSSPFFLKGLDEEQSWKLFTQLAFENGKEPENKKFTAVGKEIVSKCAGVPLAIRSIGSLMYSKVSEKDWSNFKDKDLVKIDEQGDRVFQLLKLSYDLLPFYLKKCFAFCSLFPKGSQINRRMLIQLWVAQGYIHSSDESVCLEDVGNEYFMDLAHRSFFQNFERDILANIFWCQMHDIVHDLAKFVTENDCIIVNEKGQHIDERARHLSFGFPLDSSWQVPGSLLSAKKLRTFLLPHHQDEEMNYRELSLTESACNLIMSSFKQLRVLDLNHLNSRTLPTCIGMLKHLRYLDLSWNEQIEMLPGSITKLQNLQTLLLNGCFNLKELPRDLWKLMSLRRLELYGCNKLTHMPRGLGGLINLHTLSMFALDTSSRHNGGASELCGLNNLRGSLEIKGLECLRCNTAEVKAINLMGKLHLETLTLTWNDKIDADDTEVAKDDIILQDLQPHENIKRLCIVGFGGVMISGWVSSFTNLIDISIQGCQRLKNLPPLHLLPHLRRLGLINLPSLEWMIDSNSSYDGSLTFFPSLKRLSLNKLPNLQAWWRFNGEGTSAGHYCHQQQPLLFRSLDELLILSCPNLISIPLHPYVDYLFLYKVSEKMLPQAFMVCTTPQVSTFTLRYLTIEGINDLKSLSGVLQHLTALRKLLITNCKELDPCSDENGDYGMKWKELKDLHSLALNGIPKMVSLPDGLQYVTTLEMLRIADCVNLTCLPEWIACLGSSLQLFRILKCPKLMSLPQGMSYLMSLQVLEIAECPKLEDRCRKEVGEDWPKISHVPKFLTS